MTPHDFYAASQRADATRSERGEDLRVVLYRDSIYLRLASDPLGAYWDLKVESVAVEDPRTLAVHGRALRGSAQACPPIQRVCFLKTHPIEDFTDV